MTIIPQRLLGEALIFSARKVSAKTAVIVKDAEYSYSDLEKSAEKLASHLINSGIKKSDRIAIFMENSWMSIVSIYRITLSGAAFIVINPQTKAEKLQYILNDSGSRILISTSLLKNEFSSILKNAKTLEEIIITGEIDQVETSHTTIRFENFTNIISDKSKPSKLPNIIPNDLAALIYTSGSTGVPKGVMMTHQSMVFATWSLIEYLRLSETDRILLLLPLAFDYGLYQLLMAITVGGTLIVEQSFIFTATIYENILRYKPTVFPGVPTIFAKMIASSNERALVFECIQKVTNTAAALPTEFIPNLKKIFPNALIFKMYGLTECKRVCYLEPELIDEKPESVGKAIPGTEVFLLSEQGLPVKPGESGILHVRGPHIMLGYWNEETLSRKMLKPGIFPGERILISNDLFKMDDEGFLYFQGRTDDIIKTRGEKVSPLEIENVIYKIDGVNEVAVIGVPDSILGESIIAFVTLHSQNQVDETQIRKECNRKLELFMVPQKVIILDEMPKNSNDKINKKHLKETYSDKYE